VWLAVRYALGSVMRATISYIRLPAARDGLL
jgi:hypothetical protein